MAAQAVQSGGLFPCNSEHYVNVSKKVVFQQEKTPHSNLLPFATVAWIKVSVLIVVGLSMLSRVSPPSSTGACHFRFRHNEYCENKLGEFIDTFWQGTLGHKFIPNTIVSVLSESMWTLWPHSKTKRCYFSAQHGNILRNGSATFS